jgi:flagellar biosynthesis chaperone FliJ
LEKAQREKEELARILQEIEDREADYEEDLREHRESKARGGYGIYW